MYIVTVYMNTYQNNDSATTYVGTIHVCGMIATGRYINPTD